MRIASAAIVAFLTSAGPLAAQSAEPYGPSLNPPPIERVEPLLDEVRDDIRQARHDGRLSRADARALRRDARRVEDAGDCFASDGLSASEQVELRNRADALRSLATAAPPPPARRR